MNVGILGGRPATEQLGIKSIVTASPGFGRIVHTKDELEHALWETVAIAHPVMWLRIADVRAGRLSARWYVTLCPVAKNGRDGLTGTKQYRTTNRRILAVRYCNLT